MYYIYIAVRTQTIQSKYIIGKFRVYSTENVGCKYVNIKMTKSNASSQKKFFKRVKVNIKTISERERRTFLEGLGSLLVCDNVNGSLASLY